MPASDNSTSLRLIDAPDAPVIGPGHPDLAGNKYGFEGGCVVKEAGVYHLFTAEMAGDPFWVKMNLAHWTSPDARHWRRVSALYATDGSMRPDDERFSLWAPMAIYNDDEGCWNLFYVAYTPGLRADEGLHMHGKIWRAVSTTPGRAGIAGPYRDVGIILQPDAESQPWEGQQGTDSFYPWQAGGKWYGFYGGHQHVPSGPWLVGLAEAPTLAGPWKRCPGGNPLPIEPLFIENPVVARISAHYAAVYDSSLSPQPGQWVAEPRHIGIAFSADGTHWPRGGRLAVQPPDGPAQWSEDLRTPLGLIPEEDGNFTVLYTAQNRSERFWSVGLARLARA